MALMLVDGMAAATSDVDNDDAMRFEMNMVSDRVHRVMFALNCPYFVIFYSAQVELIRFFMTQVFFLTFFALCFDPRNKLWSFFHPR